MVERRLPFQKFVYCYINQYNAVLVERTPTVNKRQRHKFSIVQRREKEQASGPAYAVPVPQFERADAVKKRKKVRKAAEKYVSLPKRPACRDKPLPKLLVAGKQ